MKAFLVTCLSFAVFSSSVCVNINILQQIGYIKQQVRQLSYYSQSSSSYIVVKLLPNIQPIDNSCEFKSVTQYNKTLSNLLLPIAENINNIASPSSGSRRHKRFAGIAIGIAALGVATAAQVTAAVSLVQAQTNARAIAAMKNSIQATNRAVFEVKEGTQQLAIAVQAIQDHINTIMNTQLNNMSCQILDNQLATFLGLYLTELTTVFQPQLINPALSPISIQALRSLLGSMTPAVVQATLSTSISTAEILSAGLMEGQIVSVLLDEMQMIVKINIPTIVTQSNALVIDFYSISSFINNQESIIQLPDRILEIGNEQWSYPAKNCKLTRHHIFCQYNEAERLSLESKLCLAGNISACVFSPIAGSYMRRFTALDGTIVANCRSLTCLCKNPSYPIYQPDHHAVTTIDLTACQTLSLDGLDFSIVSLSNITYAENLTISLSQTINTQPIDISTELSKVNASLQNAVKYIKESNHQLQSVSVNSKIGAIIVAALVLSILSIIISLLFCCWAYIATKEIRRINFKTNHINTISSSVDDLIRY
uniref:Fusion glycoprotein F0 n=1 Tax=Mumps orthorubulavirus TaxID=2560602 RepID=Q910N7_MUMPV|nr:F [Mumps orthorubulavirus] [Mumps orthorubulavirus]AAK60070.1 F [Mumps orthorubulavirus] [Mumps orthorubulavirus]AAK60079.1 F [Mumps orthorubulavirus] [Mumps orthorubulavirus]AAK60088.1 F [Mumps orthorubulavirus] [Mumps orthorubulavirus]AAK60097.1 F [Mumps orthorubulavirus] [Mumps orthorubulavirus]